MVKFGQKWHPRNRHALITAAVSLTTAATTPKTTCTSTAQNNTYTYNQYNAMKKTNDLATWNNYWWQSGFSLHGRYIVHTAVLLVVWNS